MNKQDQKKWIDEYREARKNYEPSAEEIFEMTAAFGPGAFTGMPVRGLGCGPSPCRADTGPSCGFQHHPLSAAAAVSATLPWNRTRIVAVPSKTGLTNAPWMSP